MLLLLKLKTQMLHFLIKPAILQNYINYLIYYIDYIDIILIRFII